MLLGTIAPFGLEDFPPDVIFPLAVQAGVVTVQAYRNADRHITPRQIVERVRQYGLSIDSIHAHYGPEADISDPDETRRRQAVDCLIGEMDFTVQLGADMMVVHPAPDVPSDGQRRRKQFLKSIEQLLPHAARREVKLLVENMSPKHSYGADLKQLIADIRPFVGEHLGLCFDTGHAHICRGDVAADIRLAGAMINYVHVTDNDGREDLHLLPFAGSIDWQAVSAALYDVGYEGIFCLEAFEPPSIVARKLARGLGDRLALLLEHVSV